MICLIEALNYRCLRYIQQPLSSFHILVGPNASGKTTFLDVVAFLGQLVSDGLETAITKNRTENFHDLLWNGEGTRFELAIEATIPPEKVKTQKKQFDTIRYEIAVGINKNSGELGIIEERALLKKWKEKNTRQRNVFPAESTPPSTIMSGKAKPGERTVLCKNINGNDNFYSENQEESGKGWYPSIRLGPRKSTLASLHEDESRFPASTWLKGLLTQGVQTFVLNSLAIKRASPPGKNHKFLSDGSNLPWVIEEMRSRDKKRFKDWINHIKTALPDISDIKTVERPDDKHRYLAIKYQGGLEVPSWMVSDGTLRFLALTLPAYLSEFKGVYLIEEPENGIHPRALEQVLQSLSSVYDAQILLATHSPIILSLAKLDDVLCFRKTDSGATDIISGKQHPDLKNWRGEPNLSVIFASGVL